MQIIARCPQCMRTWILDGQAADRRVTCPDCGRLFKIPRLDEVPKAAKVISQAHGPLYVDSDGKTYG